MIVHTKHNRRYRITFNVYDGLGQKSEYVPIVRCEIVDETNIDSPVGLASECAYYNPVDACLGLPFSVEVGKKLSFGKALNKIFAGDSYKGIRGHMWALYRANNHR